MFVAFVTVLILASAALTGARFGRLAQLRIRHAWLIIGALLVQVLITDVVPGAPKPLLVGLHLASYAVAGIGIWANRSLPGLVLVAIGALLNAVTIALNGGTLPASPHALAAAGLTIDPKDFANSGIVAHPVLAFLGDIMATPSWLPFRNVLSIGDIVILVGAAVLIHGVTRTVPARAVARWADGRRGTPARHRASSYA